MIDIFDNTFDKDPDAVLDYQWDWELWLQPTEVITNATITVPDGIVLDSSSHDDTTVTAWLSGGTAGIGYMINCHIETLDGAEVREDDRSIYIVCRER